MALELEYDRSLYEKEFPAGPFEVTKEQIRAFAESIGDSNPVFLDESAAQEAGYSSIAAPPTFCTLLIDGLKLPDIGLKFGKLQAQAGSRVRVLAPVVAGDRLTASSRLKDVYAKTGRSGAMVFCLWEHTFRNQDGQVVAEVTQSFARRD